MAIQLTQISQECPHEERGRGPPLTIFPQQIVNFLGKHFHFLEGHHVQNDLRSSRIVLKNRSFDKKPVVFHRPESRWCQVCNLLCQFLTRSQFGRSAPLCEKWTEKKGNMDKKRGAGNVVKKCMRRDFCARRERGVRKIVIWHPRWVNMRIEFGNFVTHQDGFLVHDDDDDCSDQNK